MQKNNIVMQSCWDWGLKLKKIKTRFHSLKDLMRYEFFVAKWI